jgi:hypothetical protein
LNALSAAEGDRIRRQTGDQRARALREYAEEHPEDQQARRVAVDAER